MKKSVFYLVIVIALSIVPSTALASEKNPMPIEKTPTEIPAEVKTMLDRLEEIKNMDKSNLKPSERKELRKEVRDMKKKIRKSGNGIYISSGAIILILLILLIL
ncbi:hypothetical protein ACFQ1R_00315 [Mariniflexile jejuense]|uniref:Seryl-tRNA synthetase n=1 Tax=Mariniflexile jejuense TaxID=1173582 RepID=A0ABW3JDH8_9FLAO